MMSSSIFRAYDIRGIYPEELDEEIAEKIGRAAAVFFQANQLIVGMDARLSGPSLKTSVSKGLVQQGVDVWDIGLVSTDQFYWACAHFNQPGIMVTASHNPPEYGGCKIVWPDLSVVGQGSGLEELRSLVEADQWPTADRPGRVSKQTVTEEFVRDFLTLFPFTNIKHQVVLDTGNGASGPAALEIAKALPGLETESLFIEPDGRFANRGPDPLQPGALEPLAERVRVSKADIGLAFDGDGDRLFVLDQDGQLVLPDFVGCLLAGRLLTERPKAAVVVDPTISRAVWDLVQLVGGQVYRERVGHAFIKKQMRERQAVFGCEKSGHYYFRDFTYADSGLLAAFLLLLSLSEAGQNIKQAVASLRERYFATPQLSVTINEPAKVILDRLMKQYADAEEQDRFDGLTISYADWWFNVRPSNNEPKIRLVVEAGSAKQLAEKKQELLDLLQVGG